MGLDEGGVLAALEAVEEIVTECLVEVNFEAGCDFRGETLALLVGVDKVFAPLVEDHVDVRVAW